jgi:hypothetical protein
MKTEISDKSFITILTDQQLRTIHARIKITLVSEGNATYTSEKVSDPTS